MTISRILSTSILLGGLAGSSAAAGTGTFIAPPFRLAADTETGQWDALTIAVGAPGNAADLPGATTGALLTQTDPGAFLTGSGNIYNASGASEFVLEDETPFAVGTVVLQARTIGSEIDPASVVLTFTNDSGAQMVLPQPAVELERAVQPGLGASVSTVWRWDLSGLEVTAYAITFRAEGPHLSFDALALDTAAASSEVFTAAFHLNDTAPVIERWMYPHNAAPCDRSAGSVFGTFGDEAGVDTRHAQHLLGWDTAALVATNRGPANYLITRCRVTLTINRGDLFAYDPTQDELGTYFAAEHPEHLPDADEGRPIELFGAGYRNGYDAASFDQCAPFGSSATGQRNAYAAGWSTNGTLIDISNHVGKTNENFAPFEVAPFAVGQTTNAAPGELVPAGSQITFELNLADPFVLAYVRQGLDSGRLRFMVTSLHETGGQFGTPTYPDFATRFNQAVVTPTRLEIEGLVAGEADLDGDGLADDWELFHLQTLALDAAADPDADGVPNSAELAAGTHPEEARSAPRIVSVERSADAIQIEAPHTANRTRVVEYTEDFVTWSPLEKQPVFDIKTGTATWRDENREAGLRFYRIKTQIAQ